MNNLKMIDVADIRPNPNQPRKQFAGITAEENCRLSAENLLNRLIPFDVWDKNLDDDTRERVNRVFGSVKDFYLKFKHELRMVAGQC